MLWPALLDCISLQSAQPACHASLTCCKRHSPGQASGPAGCSFAVQERRGPSIGLQILLYPMTDYYLPATESMRCALLARHEALQHFLATGCVLLVVMSSCSSSSQLPPGLQPDRQPCRCYSACVQLLQHDMQAVFEGLWLLGRAEQDGLGPVRGYRSATWQLTAAKHAGSHLAEARPCR